MRKLLRTRRAPFVREPLNERIFFRILFFILKQFVEGKNLMLKIHAHVFCISKIRMHFFCDSSCKNDCEIKKRRRKTAYRNSSCFFEFNTFLKREFFARRVRGFM